MTDPATGSDEAPVFDNFWLNSTLTRSSLGDFAARMDEHATGVDAASRFAFAAAPLPLPRPRGRFWTLLRKRRSERTFSHRPLTPRAIGDVLCAAAVTERGRRAYASAGGTYPLEVLVLVNACTDAHLQNRALHYDPAGHTLTPVHTLPAYGEYSDIVNLGTGGTVPAMVVVILAARERTTKKYGERGGRFVLIEAGQVAQGLMLAAAQQGLACCAAGGLLDNEILRLAGLAPGDADVVLGLAVGHCP